MFEDNDIAVVKPRSKPRRKSNHALPKKRRIKIAPTFSEPQERKNEKIEKHEFIETLESERLAHLNLHGVPYWSLYAEAGSRSTKDDELL